MCLGMFFCGSLLCGIRCVSLTSASVSLPKLGKFWTLLSRHVVSGTLTLSSPSGTPMMQTVVCLLLSRDLLGAPQFCSFFFSLFWGGDFQHSVFHLIDSRFCLHYLAVDFFEGVFHFRYGIIHPYLLTLQISSSLLNICNFSICVSVLFLRSGITLAIIPLNSLSGTLAISSSFSCFCGVYLIPSCEAYFSVISFCLTFCLWSFHRLQDCSSSCFQYLSPGG